MITLVSSHYNCLIPSSTNDLEHLLYLAAVECRWTVLLLTLTRVDYGAPKTKTLCRGYIVSLWREHGAQDLCVLYQLCLCVKRPDQSVASVVSITMRRSSSTTTSNSCSSILHSTNLCKYRTDWEVIWLFDVAKLSFVAGGCHGLRSRGGGLGMLNWRTLFIYEY